MLWGQNKALLGHSALFVNSQGPHPWMSPAPARKRSDTPSVKHGWALEEGKMLNCVATCREKQQTWLDWLTILLWWDMTRKKPVSVSLWRAEQRSWGLSPGRQCVLMLMLDSSAPSLASRAATTFPFLATSHRLAATQRACVYMLNAPLAARQWVFT